MVETLPLRVRSLEEAELHVQSMTARVGALELAVRRHEKLVDTLDVSLRRRIVFALDGWPLFRLAARPQWRPWRRWWMS